MKSHCLISNFIFVFVFVFFVSLSRWVYGEKATTLTLANGKIVTIHFTPSQLRDLHSMYKQAIRTANSQLDKKFKKWQADHPPERHIILHIKNDLPVWGKGGKGKGKGEDSRVEIPAQMMNWLSQMMMASRLQQQQQEMMLMNSNPLMSGYGSLQPKVIAPPQVSPYYARPPVVMATAPLPREIVNSGVEGGGRVVLLDRQGKFK